MGEFIPCADEVWRLHNLKEADCLHFQKWCDEGGTLNGEGERATRQGTYCCTPSGVFLGSANHRDPKRIAEMLRGALKKWKEIKKEDRLLKDDPVKTWEQINRNEKQYPTDGMVLRVNSRDMPRTGLDQNDWRTHAWNFDYAWFRKDEVARMLPKVFEKKAKWQLPADLVQRTCRLHLVDNVRGQTPGFAPENVSEAEINCEVTRLKKGVVTIQMTGKVKLEQGQRGLEAKMLGEAQYNTKTEKFDKFELVVVGQRWGATQFNRREDDRERSPIGYVLSLASDHATEKVAPTEFGSYGWR
ncbi:MAG: hypothetical protein IPK87_06085 [Planctomycetes bacterium]|nr:hypothetical protein [Planctomycetota bacterium]